MSTHAHSLCFCGFFQAEDGIRDYKVTGVQTCALPIFLATSGEREHNAFVSRSKRRRGWRRTGTTGVATWVRRNSAWPLWLRRRSEERRVGKEWRSCGGRKDEHKAKTDEQRSHHARQTR